MPVEGGESTVLLLQFDPGIDHIRPLRITSGQRVGERNSDRIRSRDDDGEAWLRERDEGALFGGGDEGVEPGIIGETHLVRVDWGDDGEGELGFHEIDVVRERRDANAEGA